MWPQPLHHFIHLALIATAACLVLPPAEPIASLRVSAEDKVSARRLFYSSHPFLKMDANKAEDINHARASNEAAENGEPVLASAAAKVLTDASSIYPWEGHSGFPTVQASCDVLLSSTTGWAPLVEWFENNRYGRPVVMLSYFTYNETDGQIVTYEEAHWPMLTQEWNETVYDRFRGREFTVVTMGNENWGYLSTWLPNRTFHWHKMSETEHMAANEFLDHPSVRMWFHLQHANVTHPKLISVPIGAMGYNQAYSMLQQIVADRVYKTTWLRQYGSDTLSKRDTAELMQRQFRHDFEWSRLGSGEYENALSRTRFVMCPSGAGFDTSCLWAAQMVGTIPIVERGSGMDRLLATMPILLVQEYEEVTPSLLKAIYPLFLLHAEDWRWDLHTKSAWFNEFHNLDAAAAIVKYPILSSSKVFTMPPECVGEFRIEEDIWHQWCASSESTLRRRQKLSPYVITSEICCSWPPRMNATVKQ